jgi:prepilin-type processing-associated H-X9-DG protein
VELLIVIAIIALLVSILLPSLARARDMARQTVCASNVRHLVISNKLYAQENDGFYVRAAADIFSTNFQRWHGRRDSANEAFDPLEGPMQPQLGGSGLKECPSFAREVDFSGSAGQSSAFEAGCGGYGYNASYVGGRNDLYGASPKAAKRSARASEVGNPSETVMFTDAAYVSLVSGNRRKIAYSFCEPPLWQLGTGAPSNSHPNPTIDFRHLDRCNVAWADGHAGPREMDFSLSYETHSLISSAEAAEQGVGWFGPPDNSLFDLE